MRKLHLGSGKEILEGWINIDMLDIAHPDYVTWDLAGGLPSFYKDESVDFIFSQHFLEHLTRSQALALLSDCYRKLKPGGVMRIVVPDLAEVVRRYNKNNVYADKGGYSPKNRCEMMNDAFHKWGHKYMYDFAELHELVREAGFNSVYWPHHRASKHPELCFLESRSETDLRCEVTK
jgi:predicted SAM-dependent methyltransferase